MAKLLLVEDKEMIRDMPSRRLERKGCQVVVAIDGRQEAPMAGGGQKARESGCDDYGTKLIDPAPLLEKIETQLKRPVGA